MNIGVAALAILPLLVAAADGPPEIAGCPILPADSIWNTPVDTLPVHPNSAVWVETIGADRPVHPDFGSGLWDGGPIGIPFVVVPGDQPKVAVSFTYAGESDPGPYPIPPTAPIEGGAHSTGDRHVLVLERDNCVLYELFSSYPQPDGFWKAGSGAVFDLRSHRLRPAGWTSADAAGLPILPGLVRYDEVAAGEIRHAIRFTAPQTQRAFVWPGRHHASPLTDPRYPPMAQRFRLRAHVAEDGFSPEMLIIVRALKKYGIMLADNGSSWYLSGAPDERWNNERLRELRRLRGSDFEAVDVSSLQIDPHSGQARLTGSAAAVVNAATYLPGPVAPGEIVSIFGGGLGPESPLTMEIVDGAVTRQLGGTTVRFSGLPAPLLYASLNQVNAVVPYALAGRFATAVRVERANAVVFEAVLPVAEASPGLFAVTDPFFMPISDAYPAASGSIVVLWANGAGLTDPPSADGGITVSEAKPKLPVTVSIGGRPAAVLWAGAAPLHVAGVFQINTQVPWGLDAGRWPLALRFGAFETPRGWTVAIR